MNVHLSLQGQFKMDIQYMGFLNSSIGRKVIMSISGLALILFIIFHGSMNLVLVFSEEAYNSICRFLGANWYALIGSMGLALLVAVHFVYGLYLTHTNWKARGQERYSVRKRNENVSWESENMLLLGSVIFGFLILHLYNFWFRMQLAEITGGATAGAFDPHDGASYVRELFGAMPDSNHLLGLLYCLLYLLWIVAIFLHLNHGVWSSLHTLGIDNSKWQKRLKIIGSCVAATAVLPFATVIIYYMCINIGMMI